MFFVCRDNESLKIVKREWEENNSWKDNDHKFWNIEGRYQDTDSRIIENINSGKKKENHTKKYYSKSI